MVIAFGNVFVTERERIEHPKPPADKQLGRAHAECLDCGNGEPIDAGPADGS